MPSGTQACQIAAHLAATVHPTAMPPHVPSIRFDKSTHLCVALCNESQYAAHHLADVCLTVQPALNTLQQGTSLTQFHHHVDVGVILRSRSPSIQKHSTQDDTKRTQDARLRVPFERLQPVLQLVQPAMRICQWGAQAAPKQFKDNMLCSSTASRRQLPAANI